MQDKTLNKKLKDYLKLATGKDIYVTSNKSLPKKIRKAFPDSAITDGKRIFLPDLKEDISEKDALSKYKNMCLEKTVEVEKGYFSKSEEERPSFDSYKHPDVASTVYQLLENEKFKPDAEEKYQTVYKKKNKDELLNNFLPIAKQLSKKSSKKLLKNCYKFSRISKRRKVRDRTLNTYTKRTYKTLEKAIKEDKPLFNLPMSFLEGLNGNSTGNSIYEDIKEECEQRTNLINTSLEDLKNELPDDSELNLQNFLEEKYDELKQEDGIVSHDELKQLIHNEINLDNFSKELKDLVKSHGHIFGGKISIKDEYEVENDFYNDAVNRYSGIISNLKKKFERLKPPQTKKIRHQYSGDEIDLEAGIAFMSDLKVKSQPDERVYTDKIKKVRDVHVGFLIDESGSMCSNMVYAKNAITILSETLEQINDTYSVFGFNSGKYVNIYPVKGCDEKNDNKVKNRIGNMDVDNETDEGPAIRFVTEYILKNPHKTNILFHISDASPNNKKDTREAILEAKQKGVHTYCLSLVSHKDNYLKELYGNSSYDVCTDIEKLPEIAAHFYEKIAF